MSRFGIQVIVFCATHVCVTGDSGAAAILRSYGETNRPSGPRVTTSRARSAAAASSALVQLSSETSVRSRPSGSTWNHRRSIRPGRYVTSSISRIGDSSVPALRTRRRT